jgi:hypothetical protein
MVGHVDRSTNFLTISMNTYMGCIPVIYNYLASSLKNTFPITKRSTTDGETTLFYRIFHIVRL